MNEKTIIYQAISPLRDDVRALMEQLNAHNLSHCPPEICHLATAEQLAISDCIMIGAFEGDSLCGMGTIKFNDDYAEVTRMFVDAAFRRRRIAHQILDRLIDLAKRRNMKAVRLETSDKFTSAVQLYAATGFVSCAPFGEYVDAAHNTYMEKILVDCDQKFRFVQPN